MLVDNESLSIETALAIIAHSTLKSSSDCLLYVSFLEDDKGVVSAEFKHRFLHVLATELGYFLAIGSTASKFDCTDSPVSYNLLTLGVVDMHVGVLSLAEAFDASIRYKPLDGNS